jgi:hypothetical protein
VGNKRIKRQGKTEARQKLKSLLAGLAFINFIISAIVFSLLQILLA